MKKFSESVGAILIIISIIIAGVNYIDVWTSKEAGLGDINYSIGFALFTFMMFILGVTLVIKSYLVDMTTTQTTSEINKNSKKTENKD